MKSDVRPRIGITMRLELETNRFYLARFYSEAVEAAGGLSYDERAKKWEGAAFNARDKFVLRLKFLRIRVQKSIFGKDETVYDYSVTTTKAGSNSPSPCETHSETYVTVTELGWVVCHSDFQEYRVALKANRFLRGYLLGYIDGKDNNQNTPSIEGGTCTKID